MWWLADPLDIHQVSDRVTTLYVERCHVDRAENAVVVVNKERTVRVPAAYIAALMLGPGTRITHGAIRLLADSGTSVTWVGESGVRMYAAGLGPARSGAIALRQAFLVSRTSERLAVARAMYGMRFPDEDVGTATMQQLRGREGARVKKIYRELSDLTGVPWSGRKYRAGDAFAAGDDINRALSAAHACLYALSHAVIVGVGAVPALGFVHTGSALSFVLDIADLYKAEVSIPVAFEAVAAGQADESEVRYRMRERFQDGGLSRRIVRDIQSLFAVGVEDESAGGLQLWDEFEGTVSGGVNWSAEADLLVRDGYFRLSGPELAEPPVDW
ncbi:MAG: type I-E CRISPR-associated endonuclease Cas1 [Tetrasphaera sp.]|nr:type I-E CRISPR-associated endonuclease Cas1 [Tetrasphaera sp.]